MKHRTALAAIALAAALLTAPALAQVIPPAAISVTGEATVSLQPQSASNRSGPSAIAGYRASNRVTIRVRDVTKVAGVIDTLVGAGANEIGGINFVVSQASKLLDEARERAVADARRKAEIYAKAASVTLGAPLSISEEGNSAPVPYRRMGGRAPASWFETREDALLTMRGNGCPHPEERALARVSKDGRESMRCV